VDPDIWKNMTKLERKDFRWSTNVRFNLPAGDSAQGPRNPGTPKYPEYRPTSKESITRTSHKKPNPKGMEVAIKRHLAIDKREWVSDGTDVGGQAASSVHSQPKTQSGCRFPSKFYVLDTNNIASATQAHTASPRPPEDLMSFDDHEINDAVSAVHGTELLPELISFGDYETNDDISPFAEAETTSIHSAGAEPLGELMPLGEYEASDTASLTAGTKAIGAKVKSAGAELPGLLISFGPKEPEETASGDQHRPGLHEGILNEHADFHW
jgi:hypothetical protein